MKFVQKFIDEKWNEKGRKTFLPLSIIMSRNVGPVLLVYDISIQA